MLFNTCYLFRLLLGLFHWRSKRKDTFPCNHISYITIHQDYPDGRTKTKRIQLQFHTDVFCGVYESFTYFYLSILGFYTPRGPQSLALNGYTKRESISHNMFCKSLGVWNDVLQNSRLWQIRWYFTFLSDFIIYKILYLPHFTVTGFSGGKLSVFFFTLI